MYICLLLCNVSFMLHNCPPYSLLPVVCKIDGRISVCYDYVLAYK